MTLDNLLNVFSKDTTKFVGNRARTLVKKKARAQINKLEGQPFNITDETVAQILNQSDIGKLRRVMGGILSLEGKAAMVVLPYKDTYIVDAIRVSHFSSIGKMETRVVGFSGATYIKDDNQYDIFTEYSFDEDGVVTLLRYIQPEEQDRYEIMDPVKFPGLNFLPVEVFLNNEDMVSDVEYAGVEQDLARLDYFDQKQKPEWERTRTMLQYNTNFTDNDPKEHTKEIDEGKGYLEEDGFNAKLGSGTSIIPAGTGTVVLQNEILFLEDDIKWKLGVKRERSGSTNRHNLEVVMEEQDLIEELIAQKGGRENHWNQFFEKLSNLLGVESPVITLEISPVEQAKLDLLEAQVKEAQMKALNVDAQVQSQTTEGE